MMSALCTLALLVAACGTPAALTPSKQAAAAAMPAGAHVDHPAVTGPDASTCGDPTASLPPPSTLPAPGHMPAGTWMAKIQARGYLIAGVDQNTYLWGYLDPKTGQYSGFDIDMLRQVSQAIFGSPDHVDFVVVPTAQRVQAVQDGKVDIVAETMTINCQREQSVDFTSVYYQAGQEILVPSNSAHHRAERPGREACVCDRRIDLAGKPGRPQPVTTPHPVGGSERHRLPGHAAAGPGRRHQHRQRDPPGATGPGLQHHNHRARLQPRALRDGHQQDPS